MQVLQMAYREAYICLTKIGADGRGKVSGDVNAPDAAGFTAVFAR